MELPNNLETEILAYCKVNNITNIDEFKIKLFKQGFTSEKFGSTPIVKTNAVVEKIVEVPIEKIIYVSDDNQVKELSDEILRLTTELEETKKLLTEKRDNKRDLYDEG